MCCDQCNLPRLAFELAHEINKTTPATMWSIRSRYCPTKGLIRNSHSCAYIEYKRKQTAPGIKISDKAFGSGRRMPIAQRYHRL